MKNKTVTLKLPKETAETFDMLAKLAGVKTESAIKLVLALHVLKSESQDLDLRQELDATIEQRDHLSEVVLGLEEKNSYMTRAIRWLFGPDTGASSVTLCCVMLGVIPKGAYYPHDPSDFGRCARLLECIPEWKPRIHEMASVSPKWASLVKAWDQITETMEKEVGIDWRKGKSAPYTYELIQKTLKD